MDLNLTQTNKARISYSCEKCFTSRGFDVFVILIIELFCVTKCVGFLLISWKNMSWTRHLYYLGSWGCYQDMEHYLLVSTAVNGKLARLNFWYCRQPLLTFDLQSRVGDVSWSPYSSTVFSAVTQASFSIWMSWYYGDSLLLVSYAIITNYTSQDTQSLLLGASLAFCCVIIA